MPWYHCGGYPVDLLMNVVNILLWHSTNMMFDSINSYQKVTKSRFYLENELILTFKLKVSIIVLQYKFYSN